MITKTWKEFLSILDKFEFEKFDLIVAIASGGIIPAAFIQQKLNIPMQIIHINYRNKNHEPIYSNAKLFEEKAFPYNSKRILLVDDVLKTGNTIKVAKQYLKNNTVKTCFINGKGNYSFFQTKACLKMPWKR